MNEMNKKVKDMQYAKFGAINEFHTNRTANFISELIEHFGEEVIQDAAQADLDNQALISWHLQRTSNLIDQLQKKYGSEVMDIILSKETEERIKNGTECALQSQNNLSVTLL